MIRVPCPRCQKALRIDDAEAGKMGMCPVCQEKFRIPRSPASDQEEPGLIPVYNPPPKGSAENRHPAKTNPTPVAKTGRQEPPGDGEGPEPFALEAAEPSSKPQRDEEEKLEEEVSAPLKRRRRLDDDPDKEDPGQDKGRHRGRKRGKDEDVWDEDEKDREEYRPRAKKRRRSRDEDKLARQENDYKRIKRYEWGPKKDKRRTSGTSGLGVGSILVGVAASGLGLVALGVLAFFIPACGIVIIVAGAIVALMGSLWFLSIALEDGVGTLLLVLFLPFYSLIYLVLNLDRTLKPFLTNLGGGVVIGVGVILSGLGAARSGIKYQETHPFPEQMEQPVPSPVMGPNPGMPFGGQGIPQKQGSMPPWPH